MALVTTTDSAGLTLQVRQAEPAHQTEPYRWAELNRNRIAEAIGSLVRIPTLAPHEPDSYGALTEYLGGAGFQTRIEPPHPELPDHPEYTEPFLPGLYPPRANLRAILSRDPARREIRGHDSAGSAAVEAGEELPTVLFSVHIDVVPPGGHPEPWSGRYDGNRIYGRGSADTKNNLVMVTEAVRCLADLGLPLRANVLLDLVTDEEAGGNGALSTILHGIGAGSGLKAEPRQNDSPEEVVVLEPTGLRVHHGHRGCLSFEITAEGQTGHMGSAGAQPNPIEDCLAAIAGLRELEERWLSEAAGHPDFAAPGIRPLQLNLSGIQADGWHGARPSRCILRASLGFLPGRTPHQAREEITAAVRGVPAGERLSIVWAGIHNDAYLGRVDSPTARRLRASAFNQGASQTGPGGWRVSCDARLYARLWNSDTVVFGSGDLALAHGDHESVELDEVLRGVAILADYLSAPELGRARPGQAGAERARPERARPERARPERARAGRVERDGEQW